MYLLHEKHETSAIKIKCILTKPRNDILQTEFEFFRYKSFTCLIRILSTHIYVVNTHFSLQFLKVKSPTETKT